jgi:hypothetical protein
LREAHEFGDDFDVIRRVNGVVVGMAVHSSEGLRLFQCHSFDSYGAIRELEPGNYTIRCVLENNPLNPGLYRLTVGSRCESKGLDWLPDVMTFRVELPEKLESLWLEDGNGLLRQESKWSVPNRSEGANRD